MTKLRSKNKIKENNYSILASYNYVSFMELNYKCVKDFDSDKIADYFKGIFYMVKNADQAKQVLDSVSYCLFKGIPFEKMEKTILFVTEYCKKQFNLNVVF